MSKFSVIAALAIVIAAGTASFATLTSVSKPVTAAAGAVYSIHELTLAARDLPTTAIENPLGL
jgi:hypothetical protein